MSDIFSKLNHKDQKEILILNVPKSFEQELGNLNGVKVARDLNKLEGISFSLAFVTKQDELDILSKQIIAKTKGDATLWFAYPKQTSKRYACEFNRDQGWQVLGDAGFEGVRQVAIDEDWSALRFRHVNHIKTLRRNPSHAISKEGKHRSSKSKSKDSSNL